MATQPIERVIFKTIPAYCSFPYLFDGRPSDKKKPDGTPEFVTYEVTACFNPDNEIFKQHKQRIIQAATDTLKAAFGSKAEFGEDYRSPFRGKLWGPELNSKGYSIQKYPYYEGLMMLPLKSRNEPVDLKGSDGKRLTDKRDLYSGCIILPSFGFYAYGAGNAQNTGGNKGVSGALRCVMKLGDSTPWVSRASADVDFEGVDPSAYLTSCPEMFAGSDDGGLNEL